MEQHKHFATVHKSIFEIHEEWNLNLYENISFSDDDDEDFRLTIFLGRNAAQTDDFLGL